jgi:hypothetical protein
VPGRDLEPLARQLEGDTAVDNELGHLTATVPQTTLMAEGPGPDHGGQGERRQGRGDEARPQALAVRSPAKNRTTATEVTAGAGAARGHLGRSRTGLRSKKPTGRRAKPQVATGITGQSSGRGKWVIPNVCHRTMSWPSMSRSAAT